MLKRGLLISLTCLLLASNTMIVKADSDVNSLESISNGNDLDIQGTSEILKNEETINEDVQGDTMPLDDVDTDEDSENPSDTDEDSEDPSDSEEDLEKVQTELKNLWDKSYAGKLKESTSVKSIATTDGGYVIFTCSEFLSANKFTNSGNLVWKVEHEDLEYKSVNDAVLLSDGSMMLVGSSVNGTSLISKILPNGKISWTKEIASEGETYYTDLLMLSTGEFVLSGYEVDESDVMSAVLTYCSADGEVVWQKQYENVVGKFVGSVYKDGYIFSAYTGDGSLFGNTAAGGDDIVIVKYDTQGNENEFKLIGGSSDDTLKQIELNTNNEIILMGSFKSDNEFSGFFTNPGDSDLVLKLDNSLEPIWGYSVPYQLDRFLVSRDGTIVLSGRGTSGILSTNFCYLESLKGDLTPTKLEFKFNGSKSPYSYTDLIQLTNNTIIGCSIITESASSFLNVRNLSLGLDITDSRKVLATVTLSNDNVVDVVSTDDNKSIVVRLNESGLLKDLTVLEGATLKELSLVDEGFKVEYLSADSKLVKSVYNNEGKLLSRNVVTSDTNQDNNQDSNAGSNNGNVSNSGSDTINKPNDSDKDDSNKDDTNAGEPSVDDIQQPSGDTGVQGPNDGANTNVGDASTNVDDLNTVQPGGDIATEQPSGGLTQMSDKSETLPYTGLDAEYYWIYLGVVVLIAGGALMFITEKYYKKAR